MRDLIDDEGFLARSAVRRLALWTRVRFAADCAAAAVLHRFSDANTPEAVRAKLLQALGHILTPPPPAVSTMGLIDEVTKISNSFGDIADGSPQAEYNRTGQFAASAVMYAVYAYRSAMYFSIEDTAANASDAARMATEALLGDINKVVECWSRANAHDKTVPVLCHQDTRILGNRARATHTPLEMLDLRSTRSMSLENAESLLYSGPEGVATWNLWRDRFKDEVDLSFVQLPGIRLAGVDLQGFTLFGACLSEANLAHAALGKADLRASGFPYANLAFADLTEVNGLRADFRHATLDWAVMSHASFVQTDMRDITASEATFMLTKFREADMRRGQFRFTNFYNANLESAVLESAELWGANLSRANLTNAVARDANFKDANLSSSIVRGADFSGAAMGNTVLGCDLTEVIGLESVKHSDRSLFSMDVLSAPAAPLPRLFLIGAGVAPENIDHFRSLSVPEYGAVFISYSRADSVFATELNEALRRRDVMCWMDVARMRAGEYVETTIRQSIQKSDYIVVCYSDAASTSDWVAKEIQLSLDKESGQSGKVQHSALLPIDLDGALSRGVGPIAGKLAERHFISFERWRDEGEFNRSLAQLLLGLRKSSGPCAPNP